MLHHEFEQEARDTLGLPALETPPPNLFWPRSRCPSCEQQLKTHHLVPLFSWLFLRGKCGLCSSQIPLRYPIIEFSLAAVSATLAVLLGLTLEFVVLVSFVALGIAAIVIDFEHELLPDSITMGILWLGLAHATFFAVSDRAIADAIVAVIGGYLLLFLVGEVYFRIRKRRGLGGGDPKLFAALGAWIGWVLLPITLLIAALLAIGHVVVTARQEGTRFDRKVPLGIHLVLAAFFVFFNQRFDWFANNALWLGY